MDIGIASIATTSTSGQYGAVSDELARRVEKKVSRFARKQKLNVCLKQKGLPTVGLDDHKAGAFARNEIGQALNELVNDLPTGSPMALERLNVKDLRFKSRLMNRRLRASQLGYMQDKLRFKLDEQGIRYRSVQPAYSSQQCSHCRFVSRLNCRTQAKFVYQHCGFVCHADVNAALNIAERFTDEELNALSFRQVEAVLAVRFAQRFPDVRSASAGLDTRVNVVANLTPRSIGPVQNHVTPVPVSFGIVVCETGNRSQVGICPLSQPTKACVYIVSMVHYQSNTAMRIQLLSTVVLVKNIIGRDLPDLKEQGVEYERH